MRGKIIINFMSCNKIWACSESKYIQAYIIFDPSVPQSSRIQNIFGLNYISWNFIFYQSIELKTKITNLKSTSTKINYDIDVFIQYSKLTIWTFKKPMKIHILCLDTGFYWYGFTNGNVLHWGFFHAWNNILFNSFRVYNYMST